MSEIDLFADELDAESLHVDELPEMMAAFTCIGCAFTFGCASGGTKGSASTIGCAS